jgi:hypothetical protein
VTSTGTATRVARSVRRSRSIADAARELFEEVLDNDQILHRRSCFVDSDHHELLAVGRDVVRLMERVRPIRVRRKQRPLLAESKRVTGEDRHSQQRIRIADEEQLAAISRP